jgi:hypothetical protein
MAMHACFEHVPASQSATGSDEIYVVFNGKRIAKRGSPGTPRAGTWLPIEPGFQVAVDGAELIVMHDTKHASVH